MALLLAVLPWASAFADEALKEATAALVIVDIQNFYFEGGSLPLTGSVEAGLNAKRLLERFRALKLAIIHVRHVPEGVEMKGNAPSDPPYAIHACVTPAPGEKVVTKQHVNSFLGTDFGETLTRLSVRRIILAGMQTHMCLEAAARAASDLGYQVIVVHDACATRPLSFGGVDVPAAHVHAATLATLNRSYGQVLSTEETLALFPLSER